MIASPFTVYRTLEYEMLRGMKFVGKTLDVGGGENNSYYHLLSFEGCVESINIDPTILPTYIADLNDRIPLEDSTYDNVLSLNTLEHVISDVHALGEMLRVLKPGGLITIAVPFLYRVHGSPCDYNRHTAYWWEAKLAELGCDPETVVIDPIIWDMLGTGLALTETWNPVRFPFPSAVRCVRRAISMLYGVCYQSLRWSKLDRVPGNWGEVDRDYALGYVITATKGSSPK